MSNHPSPKHKVPRLVLSDTIETKSDTISRSSPKTPYIDLHTQIQVLCGKISEMQSEQDLEKLHAIYDAKKSLASRTDITYYITADDLIKVQQTDAKVYLRLCPDSPQTARRMKSSPHASPSPTRRNDGATLHIRKESKRSNSVDTVRNEVKPASGSRPRIKHVTNATSRVIMLRSGSFSITYEKLVEPVPNHQYFAVEEQGTKKLICKVLSDSQLRSDVIMRYDCHTINNTNSKICITIYSPNIRNAEFPMYFQINNDMSVENFIDMIPDLISESQEKYKPSKLEITLRDTLSALAEKGL